MNTADNQREELRRGFRPKCIRPWSPGSVAPIPYRSGPPDAANEIYDRPTSIRELARQHRVRWYRDACGDDNIPGKYGEIFRYGVGKLGVQIGGPRANNTKTNVPEGSNKYINTITRRCAWPISQAGDGEIVFIVEETAIKDALKAIKAYRMPKGPSHETRAKGLIAMEKYQFKTAGKRATGLQDQ